MYFIPSRIAKIDFTVLNNRIRPIGDVNRPIRTNLDINRPEGVAQPSDQFRLLLGGIPASLFIDTEANNSMRSKITGDRRALPLLGELFTVKQFQPAILGIGTRADALQNPRCPGIGEIHRPGHSIGDALIPGPIGDKRLPIAIHLVSPRIAEALHKHTQLEGVRTKVPHPATVQPLHTMGRFNVAVDIDRLVHVKLTIMAPTQGVKDVVGIFSAKPGKDHPPLIGPAVAIRVLEMQQLGALPHVDPAIPGFNSRWNEKPLGEHR